MTRKSVLALALTMLGCDGGVVTQDPEGTQTNAEVQTASAGPTCVGGDNLTDPPSFTLMDMLDILGKVQFYSASPSNIQLLFTGFWTNWYNDPINSGLAKLATMRGVLDK